MAGWLGLAGTGIRSAFRMSAMLPEIPFRAISRQQFRTNQERSGRNAEKEKEKWMEESRKGDGWIKEEEEEFPLSVLRIHLSVTRTLIHSSACTNTHTIGFGVRTSDRRGNSSHATLCVCVST